MKKHGFLTSLLSILLAAAVVYGVTVPAFSKESDNTVTMTVSSGCYVYSSKSTATSKRAGYFNFGQDINVTEYGEEWSIISYAGKQLYIRSTNIAYKKYEVRKNRVLVSKGAYATSEKTSLGYLYFADKVSFLGEEYSRVGVKYIHCIIEKTYDADKNVYLRNTEGYINAEYMETAAVPKIVNEETNIYSYAYSSSSADYQKNPAGQIEPGETVECVASNSTWSKIIYNGRTYYVLSNKLSPYKLNIIANRVAQTADARPGSGILHYVYWNTQITVLSTYMSDNYGRYFYCSISGDKGFIREISDKGVKYTGSNSVCVSNMSTNLYYKADDRSKVIFRVTADTDVTVEYENGTWARVSVNSMKGYMLCSKLSQRKYLAKGASYSTGYRLYSSSSSSSVNERVSLLCQNSKYGYSYVENEKGSRYYIKSKDLVDENKGKTGYVAVPRATLHLSAVSESEYIALPYMTELTVFEPISTTEEGSWIKVRYNNKFYYVWQSAGDTIFCDEPSLFKYSADSEITKKVIDEALRIKALPTKYAHNQSDGVADEDGKYGFDCSGFASFIINSVMTQYVPTYKISANIKELYNTKSIYNKGYTGESKVEIISLKNIKAGDVIFFNLEDEREKDDGLDGCNHCGIYLGKGEFIHATHSWGGGVCIMPLSGVYLENIVAVKRYIPEKIVSAGKVMYTTSQKTNIYAEKSSDGTPGEVLEAEIPVKVMFTDNGNWAYVEYGENKHGFVLVKYLTEQIEEVSLKKYIASSKQKLYENHTTDSAYIELKKGDGVIFKGRYSNSSYYKIEYGNRRYFIYAPDGYEALLSDTVAEN